MVNSKKSTKSLIALVVMALLLVASIALAATGAWFSDSGTGSAAGKFGTVSVDESISVSIAENPVLPGDTITITNPQYTGDVAAYYEVVVKIVGEGIATDKTTYGYIASAGAIDLGGNVTVPEAQTAGQGQNITINITVTVIQARNLGTGTDAAAAEAAFQTFRA